MIKISLKLLEQVEFKFAKITQIGYISLYMISKNTGNISN